MNKLWKHSRVSNKNFLITLLTVRPSLSDSGESDRNSTASGTVEDVENEIVQELSYQSSMELDHDTYEAIRGIPTSQNIITSARQQLVQRLDGYQRDTPQQFAQVIDIIKRVFIPVFRRHALAGAGRVVIQDADPSFALVSSEESVSVIVDILADRDFSVIGVERKEYGIMFDVRFRARGLHH